MSKAKIPSIFDLPPSRRVPMGELRVNGAMRKDTMRSMISALESVGYVVRIEDGVFKCHVSGKELFVARKGNRGTYLVRYAEGILALVEEQK